MRDHTPGAVARICAYLVMAAVLTLSGCSGLFGSRQAPVATPASVVTTVPRAAQVSPPPQSAAPKPVMVPNVVGSDLAGAEAALRRAGLDFVVSWVNDANVAHRRVISQSPVAGARLAWGSGVNLRVSLGKGTTLPSTGAAKARIDQSLLPGVWEASGSGAKFSRIQYGVGTQYVTAVSFGDNFMWSASIDVTGQTFTVSVPAKSLTTQGRITKLTSTTLLIDGIGTYKKTTSF